MRTKISVFCEQIIEVGWLFALIITPLFFNIFSSRVFEPDKLALLRTIASVLAVAWVVKTVETFRGLPQANAREAFLAWLKRPLSVPILLTVLAYLVATAASIAPRISLWGSYQRLQGTYTTLSYLVICGLLLEGLRTRAQLERLVTAVILTSLPIALYGLVQHHALDLLPWGGDVTSRVASNLGNAIFVSAYLIMVIPLTVARWLALQRRAVEDQPHTSRGFIILCVWLLWLGQAIAWFALPIGQAMAVNLLLIGLLVLLARYARASLRRFALMGVYASILALQLSCLIFSQSRGPLLGLLAGLFLMGILYLIVFRHRRGALFLALLALAGLFFLVLFNVPKSPLEPLRRVPYIGRLGRVLEMEKGSGRVRVLIWQGNVALLRSNPLRILTGYGPEAMYVAYNRFYPPELGHYEARNASPDRSHNETFDALIMTGLLGLAAYLALFGALFYWGLKWLGLVPGRRARNLLWLALIGGGLLGVLIPLLITKGWVFFGVGLPLGMVAGLGLYVLGLAMRGGFEPSPSEATAQRDFWVLLAMMGLFGALVAHFVEINVGISIAATRTYLWVYAAILVVLGSRGLAEEAAAPAPVVATAPGASRPAARKRRGRAKAPPQSRKPTAPPAPSKGWAVALCSGLIGALILGTMAYDYTINPRLERNPVEVIIGSLIAPASADRPTNAAMALLVLFVFGALTYILLAEQAETYPEKRDEAAWLGYVALFVLSAGGLALIYALIHASRLIPGPGTADLITEYYVFIALVGLAAAGALYAMQAKPAEPLPAWHALADFAAVVVVIALVSPVNIGSVKADIVYKQGLKYDSERNWDAAIPYYQRATEMAPKEDYYYLFLGRALLEKAKATPEGPARETQFTQAIAALERARTLNPLNTDHTANLARAYRSWADLTTDPALRQARFEQSLAFYQRALTLSPNNAQLWNEQGLVYFMTGQYDQALALYEHSLRLDPEFAQTYLLLGDVYFEQKAWDRAIEAYSQAVALEKKATYAWSRMAYAYVQLGDLQKGIEANLKVLNDVPDDYVTLGNLAYLYDQVGRPADALPYAEKALAVAPAQDKARWESLVEALKAKLQKG